jgi:hypothetical protein
MMARWICPYCEEVTTVAPLIVGHASSCPGCGQESTVVDADAEQIGKLRLEKALETANSRWLRSVLIANCIIGILAAGTLLIAMYLLLSGSPGGVFMGMMLMISTILVVAVISVIFEGVNEVHRCRKLLEELLRKRG